MYTVYECYGANGDLLYVGVTSWPLKTRLTQHRTQSPWFGKTARVESRQYDHPAPAAADEERTIVERQPPYNRDKTGVTSVVWGRQEVAKYEFAQRQHAKHLRWCEKHGVQP